MTCSPARVAANRANALKSTGPKTEAGKAKARLNALRHGLAGAGDLVAPGEDAALVAARAAAFVRELGAPGEVGQILAHRAALLSVRMERSAEREEAVVASNVAAARDEFDRDRCAALAGAIEALDGAGADLRAALTELETTPAGLAHLIESWRGLRAALGSTDPAVATPASLRATSWLDRPADAPRADLLGGIDAELARLRPLAAGSAGLAADWHDRREDAASIASFDPSPEARLAHRYEAAAERGMYRAIAAIAALRRAREAEVLPGALGSLPSPPSPLPPAVPARPLPATQPPAAPLGSFRASDQSNSSPVAAWIGSDREPALLPTEPRKKRPDLRKLSSNRR